MRRIFVALLLSGIAATSLCAQTQETPAPAAGSPETTDPNRIKVRVNLVNVLFTVTDKKNRRILDLKRDDFQVLEDNKPQSIRYFSRETDLPLRIGLVLDTSNSVRDRLRFEQEAAIDFLSTTVRPKQDLAYLVSFDTATQLVQDYTDDVEKLSDAIRELRAGGGTALFDTIYFACKEKMLFFPPPDPYLRRVLVVISDGQDNQSEHTRDEALAMAQRGEVIIFAISTNRTGVQGQGDKVLKYLAQETGGRAFFPFAAADQVRRFEDDLATNFEEISRELRSQYSLAYFSTNRTHDGTFRNVSIRTREKDVNVRAKSGYFAPSK
jgi:VWFA-related protein